MEFKELKEFIKKLYPVQPIDFTLDKSCIYSIEFPFNNGERRIYAKIYYNKMLVSIKNMDAFYVDIPSYVEEKFVADALLIISDSKIYISEKDLQDLRDADVKKNLNRPDHGRDEILTRIMAYSNRSEEEVLKLAGLQ